MVSTPSSRAFPSRRPGGFDGDELGLGFAAALLERDLDDVVARNRHAGPAEIGARRAVLLREHFDELLGELSRLLDDARIEVLEGIGDAHVLSGLRFKPELVRARADFDDQILAAHEHARARTGDVLVGRAPGEIDRADLERARLFEERDARSHVRASTNASVSGLRGNASAFVIPRTAGAFRRLIGVMSRRRGAPPVIQAFSSSA